MFCSYRLPSFRPAALLPLVAGAAELHDAYHHRDQCAKRDNRLRIHGSHLPTAMLPGGSEAPRLPAQRRRYTPRSCGRRSDLMRI